MRRTSMAVALSLATGTLLLLSAACSEEQSGNREGNREAVPIGQKSNVSAAAVGDSGSAPKHPNVEPRSEQMFVGLGRVRLSLPTSWRPTESGSPPMHQVHLNPGPGMTCDIGLIEGHGRAEEAERYLNAASSTYRGEVSRSENLTLGGVTLQGITVKGPQALPGVRFVEAFVGILGDDLVGLNFTQLRDAATTERKACEDAFSRFVKALR